MKKLFFIVIVSLICNYANAQTFTVGDKNCNYNLVNKTFTSSVSLPSYSNQFGFDIDGDATNDIDIYSGYAWSGSAQVPSIRRISVTSSTSCEFIYGSPGSGCYYTSTLANLTLGALINSSLNWSVTATPTAWGSPAPHVYYHEYKSSYNFTCGSQVDPFYIGFRKILPGNDTIYGWLRMSSIVPGVVYDYAYKQVSNTTSPPASTFVTTATAICIGDSLDLNASPSGGIFSGFGVAGNKFKSGALSTGTHNVYYTMPNSGGCTVASMLTLTVNPLPTISLFNWFYNLCSDDTLEINAYPIGAPFVYSGPGLVGNTFYATQAGIGEHTVSISITDGNGCTKISNLNIDVNSCVGINELQSRHSTFEVFPNPNNGEFEIKGIKEETIFIKNELGLLIQTKNLEKENNYSIRINNLQSGVYFIGNKFSQQKVVVIK